MSALRNKAGDPVWVITITGWHDIFRMAWNPSIVRSSSAAPEAGPCKWMRRSVGVSQLRPLDESMTGGKAKRWSTRRRSSL